MSANVPLYYTSSELATLCRVHRKTVNTWIAKGWIKATLTPGGRHKMEPVDVLAFLQKHRYPVPAALWTLLPQDAS
jgi:excisionase family DNA binding protein